MPVYEHHCAKCKRTYDMYRPVSQAAAVQRCPDCDCETSRVYSFETQKEFAPYYDEKFGCEVLSAGKEQRLMKKHKQIYTRDAMSTFRDKQQIKQILDRKKWNMKRGIGV